MRVFLDTNVWVAALATRGLCAELLEQCLARHAVLTSALLRAEFDDVVERKLAPAPATWAEIGRLWAMSCAIPDAAPERGDNDTRLLEAAADARAEAFVTGDKAVLERRSHRDMPIRSPRQMYAMLIGIG